MGGGGGGVGLGRVCLLEGKKLNLGRFQPWNDKKR